MSNPIVMIRDAFFQEEVGPIAMLLENLKLLEDCGSDSVNDSSHSEIC